MYQQQERRQTRFRVTQNNLGLYADMEEQLYDWIIDKIDRGFCVNGGMIRAEALSRLDGTNFQEIKLFLHLFYFFFF